jgi:hypothetical protein
MKFRLFRQKNQLSDHEWKDSNHLRLMNQTSNTIVKRKNIKWNNKNVRRNEMIS